MVSGARLNFAENLLRFRDERIALVSILEDGRRQSISYGQLYQNVAGLAALRTAGVEAGDRVAGFMPNIIETVEAMLATASLGAVWSSCSPDFGINGVLDRFGQIQPKVLFSADGYIYNGKSCDSLERLSAIADAIPSLERVVVVPLLSQQPELADIEGACLWTDFTQSAIGDLDFAQLPFDQPLYIMYLGHDRYAQVHCPRRRGHAATAPQGASPARRFGQGGRVFLFHHLWLDDVELAGFRAGQWRDPGAL